MEHEFDPTVVLNNGVRMPAIGLGVYQVSPGQATEQAVSCALEAGYRLIDTAQYYANEKDVGSAVSTSGIHRSDIFVTTKLWKDDHGFKSALRAFDSSLAQLGLAYLDLYLIHWPDGGSGGLGGRIAKKLRSLIPRNRAVRLESWKALEKIHADGRCRAIGVSNYTVRHLQELLSECKVVPAVNQVEFTPFCFQKELLEYCQKNNIQLQAYSPLTRGERLQHPILVEVATRNHRTVAQVLLRWALQHHVVVIPKASQPRHIRENLQVFDFVLPEKDMQRLNGLNEDLHFCWDPTNVS